MEAAVSTKNSTLEKKLNILTDDFQLMKVKNGELENDLIKLKTQTTSTAKNLKSEVKQLAVSDVRLFWICLRLMLVTVSPCHRETI